MSKTPFRRRGAAIIAAALPAAALAHPARAEHTPPPPATPLADTILVTARPAAARFPAGRLWRRDRTGGAA